MYCWYRSIKYSIKAVKVKASWLFTNEIQELAIMQNFRASIYEEILNRIMRRILSIISSLLSINVY